MNADLRLDAAEAARREPGAARAARRRAAARLGRRAGAAGVLRQSALIANVWTGLGAETALTVAPGRHHFDVIAGLAEPNSALVEALVGAEG